MRVALNWKDYEILDTSSGEKLEMWHSEPIHGTPIPCGSDASQNKDNPKQSRTR